MDLGGSVDTLKLDFPEAALEFLDIFLLAGARATLVITDAFEVCAFLQEDNGLGGVALETANAQELMLGISSNRQGGRYWRERMLTYT